VLALPPSTVVAMTAGGDDPGFATLVWCDTIVHHDRSVPLRRQIVFVVAR